MLEDFGEGSTTGRRRFGLSAVVSIFVFSTMTSAVFAASAAVRRVVVQDEEPVRVEFAPPPAPEPPPRPPPAPSVQTVQAPERPPARLGTPRPRLEAPTVIPDSLPAPRETSPGPPPDPFAPELEGDPHGAPDGVGLIPTSTPPAVAAAVLEPRARARGPVRVIEGTRPPEFDREEIARNFEIPSGVAGSGLARITVVVRVTVHEDGSIARVEVLRGHPLIPNEHVIRAVERSHAAPARMGDGTPYAVIHTLPITLALTL